MIAAVVAAVTAAMALLTAAAAHWPSATCLARFLTSPLGQSLVRDGLVGPVDGVEQVHQRAGPRLGLGATDEHHGERAPYVFLVRGVTGRPTGARDEAEEPPLASLEDAARDQAVAETLGQALAEPVDEALSRALLLGDARETVAQHRVVRRSSSMTRTLAERHIDDFSSIVTAPVMASSTSTAPPSAELELAGLGLAGLVVEQKQQQVLCDQRHRADGTGAGLACWSDQHSRGDRSLRHRTRGSGRPRSSGSAPTTCAR